MAASLSLAPLLGVEAKSGQAEPPKSKEATSAQEAPHGSTYLFKGCCGDVARPCLTCPKGGFIPAVTGEAVPSSPQCIIMAKGRMVCILGLSSGRVFPFLYLSTQHMLLRISSGAEVPRSHSFQR